MLRAGNGYDVVVAWSADDGDSNSPAMAGGATVSVRVVNNNVTPAANVALSNVIIRGDSANVAGAQ